MRPAEAEKLLGGYATGTLTEEERRHLFAAALDHQELFDALMDEEVLRELLADRAVKAQLILALAHSATPNVVPFWRRPGVLGAAAGLLVATTAGLAYLRSPSHLAAPALEAAKAKAMKADGASAAAAPSPESKAVAEKARAAEPAPASAPAVAAVAMAPTPPPPKADLAAREEGASRLAKAESPKVASTPPAKLADAPPAPAPALLEVVQSNAIKEDAAERRRQPAARLAAVPPGGVPAGVVGGIVGGIVGGAVGGAPASAPAQVKKAETRSDLVKEKGSPAPRWTLEPGTEGRTRVVILAVRKAKPILLKRGGTGVSVLRLQPQPDVSGEVIPWRCEVPLGPGEVLDLYLLDHEVADPATLPETGPVAGFRARIHPRP